MTKIVKIDYAMAKLLSYNCRYLYDICTIELKYFGDIAEDIYDSTLLLEGSACSYKQDTFTGGIEYGDCSHHARTTPPG